MLSKLGKLATVFGMGKMSQGEYRANINGINMFFGAVLGVVLAGMEKLTQVQFGLALLMLAGNVTSILFITGSRHRVVYAIYTIIISLATPSAIDFMLRTKNAIPDKVVPTLLVWTFMTIMVEFWGRDTASPEDAE